MSRDISWLTAFLWLLPVTFVVLARTVSVAFVLPAGFLLLIYALIWFWFRPTRFEVDAAAVTVCWPLRTEAIPRQALRSARIMDAATMKAELGRAFRIGAGGLWGGFGLLHTARQGMVRFYISRTDQFVWLEMNTGRHWLITPDDPDAFLRALNLRR